MMNNGTDEKWQALLAAATPTFAGERAVPYGFTTQTLARLRAEQQREIELLDKIGLRALFAALAVLVMAGGFSVAWQLDHRVDVDPGVISLVVGDDVPIS